MHRSLARRLAQAGRATSRTVRRSRRSAAAGRIEPLEPRCVLAASLSVTGPSGPLLEGERAAFTLRLSEPLRVAERVAVTLAAQTATYGSDFFGPLKTQVLFAPGQTVANFTVPTLRDTGVEVREGAETFRVSFEPTNPAIKPTSIPVTILDYVPQPRISVADISVTEGNAGTTNAVFTVALSSAYPKPVTVNYATRDVSATVAGADYVAASGTLTIAPGQTSQAITVAVNADTQLEPNEQFRLQLSAPVNATLARSTATCTIVNDETDQPGFQITVEYITSFYGEVPTAVRSATQQAVNRWQQVITGDVPGFLEQSTGKFVDDFRMRVQMGLLGEGSDGTFGTLANASPVQTRAGANGLPWLGDTGIDPADVTNPQLVNILIHEIGHALGFAPGIDAYDRWVTGTNWTGPNAVREYANLNGGNVTGVPLETGGGGGTAGAHWSEDLFDTELMTGYVEPLGVPMPLSRLTVGAFADIGYTVNYGAADAYTLPAGGGAGVGGGGGPGVGTTPSRPGAPRRSTRQATLPGGTGTRIAFAALAASTTNGAEARPALDFAATAGWFGGPTGRPRAFSGFGTWTR